ncbi:TadE/TadG family type IV pilus assembly protein [Cognatishimia sp.]|uniref:TadE/TadG family type IV pilus assembly protein n=1 Tax=Cognatishimia sp. TaxID=2211648 RepID=UPI003511D9D2
MLKRKFLSALRNFRDDTRGVISIEMVVILPLLLWSFAAVATFFDAYRARSLAEKAAFTISDMLSRETNAVNAQYITNTRTLFDELASSQTDSSLRVSVISWNSALNAYEIDWSEARGTRLIALENSDMDELEPSLPVMSDSDVLILVETLGSYTPMLNVGIGSASIDTFVFTRPRYAPQLVFEGSSPA